MMDTTFRLDDYLPFRLFVTSSSVSTLLSSACDSLYDVKMAEWRILAALNEAGPSTQFYLVKRVHLDKVSVSRAVQSLVKRHLLRRFIATNDGRSHHLALTDTGRDLVTRLIAAAHAYEAALVADLTPEEVVQLKKVLLRVQAAAESARHPARDALKGRTFAEVNPEEAVHEEAVS